MQVLRLAVVAAVTGLIHCYLWWRLVRTTTRPGRWRRAGGLAVLVLALLLPATLADSRVAHWLAWPGYLWLALMFYLLVLLALLEVPLLVARLAIRAAPRGRADPAPHDRANPAPHDRADPAPHGRTGPASSAVASPNAPSTSGTPALGPDRAAGGDPGRRLLLARSVAIVAGLTAAGATGYGVSTALGPPHIKRVQIPLAKLDRRVDGYRIALVSDIHLGPLRGRAHTERIVNMINRLDPDLVAVVGDLVDGSVAELGPAAAPLRDLRSRHGSFFVTGNHEYYSGYREWVREVARLGVRPLRNERVEIVAGAGAFDLAGVNDVAGDGYGDPPDFDRALAGRDPGRPVVLLAHQPVQVHQAARHGVDLQLSGHTHGGQLYPFHLLVRLQQPVVSGLATVDGTQVYVTNGAGFWGPPVRVGAPPEITLVQLRAQ